MSHGDDTPTIPEGHVPHSAPQDGTTPKYLSGFRVAVRSMMGPQPHQWIERYDRPDQIEQLLAQAYQRGLLDGYALRTPVNAPGPVDVPPETPRETREAVAERLGLFAPPTRTPQPISAFLEAQRAAMEGLAPSPVGDYRTWMVRQARIALNTDLADAMTLVRSVTE